MPYNSYICGNLATLWILRAGSDKQITLRAYLSLISSILFVFSAARPVCAASLAALLLILPLASLRYIFLPALVIVDAVHARMDLLRCGRCMLDTWSALTYSLTRQNLQSSDDVHVSPSIKFAKGPDKGRSYHSIILCYELSYRRKFTFLL